MLKRLFDLIISGLALLVLWPILLVIAAAVRLESPGPAFYRARRVGLHGHEFSLFKFRSMVVDADKRGPGLTLASDQRITRVGRFLRHTKLDELPQLMNVFIGDMSLVGPRPEDPRYVALYSAQQRGVLDVRPGITSAASVMYRHETSLLSGPAWEQHYISEIMPAKLAMDLNYVQKSTLWTDFLILFRTLIAIFR
jgi:lipopolysaccharide/colanic/teichoic acid biosynthesis glycosyltransferase